MDQYANSMADVLKRIGIDPLASQIASSNGRAWIAQVGGVVMLAALVEADGAPALRVNCPILYMPSRDLLPFYRRMLDLNSELGGAALAMDKDVVSLLCRQSIEGLSSGAVETLLLRTLKLADIIGDALVAEFHTARYWHPM